LVWRNASYLHDYAGFFFIVPVSLSGGIFLEKMWARQFRPTWNFRWLVLVLLLVSALVGYSIEGTRDLHRKQTPILEPGTEQGAELIPQLGREISRTFAPDVQILCNFPWQGPHLDYYADRILVYGFVRSDQWQRLLSNPVPLMGIISRGNWKLVEYSRGPGQPLPLGGLVWLEGPGGQELLASLPEGERKISQVGPFSFCFWQPD
jgi:hypothetical protein